MRYFDYNATTPVRAVAREAWLQTTDRHWHNPSSLYREAGFAAQELERLREQMADVLGVSAERVVFTSGATESNNAVFADAAKHLKQGQRVLLSAIEHPSVRAAARAWVGADRVDEVAVNLEGVLEPEQVERWLEQCGAEAGLVSVMAANNEGGQIQPWPELAELCRGRGVPFHSDATQWLGKEDPTGLGALDWLSFSGHKLGGPKGGGVLVLPESRGSSPLAWSSGGPQESGHRAGTENLAAIAALAAALEEAEKERGTCFAAQTALRDRFEHRLTQYLPGTRVIGAGAARLGNTSLLVMPRHSNLKWLTRLSQKGFAISTGSACSSGREGSSVVVRALGSSEEELRRVIRISSGGATSAADWEALTDALLEVASDLEQGGATGGRRIQLGG